MSWVLHRQPNVKLPLAMRGDGVYLHDRDGKQYLDASGGAAVSCLGYNHPQVLAAMRAQIERLCYVHTAFFTTAPLEQLATHLTEHAPANLRHAYFVSGGSEAIESALKLARQYFVEIGEPQRTHFIARRQSYHGNTLGALAVGGNAARRALFSPLLIETSHIAPCYAYRGQRPDETEAEYAHRIATELEQEILQVGARKVIAFVAETVGGATAGVLPPVAGYFQRVREICDRYRVLLIIDEVMCGLGRCGTLYTCEAEGVRADMVALAKGLGGGYQPIGALLFESQILDAIVGGSGAFSHGHTYIGHTLACAAALAVQQTIQREQLLANVQQRGRELMDGLQSAFGNHPHIGDIRGRGLFVGLEFVKCRQTKTPFAPSTHLHTRLKQAAMQNGLMVYPGAGGVDGINGHHLMLAPPFIYQSSHVAELLQKLERSVADALIDVA